MIDTKLFIGGANPPSNAAEAEAALLRALASDEDRLGPDHADVGVHLNNLAALLLGTGRAQEALPLAVRARDIMLGAFDGDHPMKRATYDTLVAVVRQVDAEGAAPPNLRPFAAQIRAMDEAARGATTQAASEPVPAVVPELAQIAIAPIPAPAPVSSLAQNSTELPPRAPSNASPLSVLGDFIFGARPPRRK